MLEMTDEEIRRIEARWKSDVDLKLDNLIKSFAKYEPMLAILIEREQERAAIRKAVIEKTLAGLIYSALIAVLVGAWHWTKDTLGWK